MSVSGVVEGANSKGGPSHIQVPDLVGEESLEALPEVQSETLSQSSGSSRSRLSLWDRAKLFLANLPRPSWIVIGLLIAAVIEVVVLASVQTANYLAFKSSQGDLGDYNQAFFTTVHGQGFFYFTVNIPAGSGGSLFAVHFSPFLVLLLPFYALAPSPVTLIVLKQLALALGVLPLYGIARVYFERQTLPLVFAALYLISPLTIAVDWNSFDPEAFIPLTLLLALYFLVRGRFWWFLAAWILTLSTIESIPALLALFAAGGLVGTLVSPPSSPWLSRMQERRFLLAALVAALAWLGVAYLALRAISPIQGAFGDIYEARYTILGASSFLDVLPQALSHPGAAAAALQFQGSQKLLFVEAMFLASGAVSVLGGLRYLLPFAGYLTLALLSNSVPLYIFGAQYPAYVSAMLFVGAIEGAVFLLDFLLTNSYQARRDALKTHLGTEVRRLAVATRGVEGRLAWREEAVRRLRTAIGQIEAGDFAGAGHEVRQARRIIDKINPTPGQPQPDQASRSEAVRTRTTVADRLRPRRGSWSLGGAAAFEAGFAILPVVCLIVASGLSNPLLSQPAAGGYAISYGEATSSQYDSDLHTVIQFIPADASVLTTNHVFPEVSDRPNAYTLPNSGFILGTTNYSVALGKWVNQSDYILTDYVIDAQNSVIFRALGNLSAFGLYAAEGEAYLYERGWSSDPAYFIPWNTSMAGGSFNPTNGNSVSRQVESPLGPSLYHPPGGNKSDKLWSGPSNVHVPPGTYQVTFFFEIAAPTNSASVQFRVTNEPAAVTDTPFATSYLGSHHLISIAPNSSAPLGTLGSATYAHYSSNLVATSVTINFTWTGTGYLSFPGYEMSTQMSMYLLSVTLVQLSSLP